MSAQIATDSEIYKGYATQVIEHIFSRNNIFTNLAIGDMAVLKGDGNTRRRLYFTSTAQSEFAIAEISPAEKLPPWQLTVFLFKLHVSEPFLYKTDQWNFRLKPNGKLAGNPVKTESFSVMPGLNEKPISVTIEEFNPPNKKTRLRGEYKDFQDTYSQYRRLAFLTASQFNEIHPTYHLAKGRYSAAFIALAEMAKQDNANSFPLEIIAPAQIAEIKPVKVILKAEPVQPVVTVPVLPEPSKSALIKAPSTVKPVKRTVIKKESIPTYARVTISVLEAFKVSRIQVSNKKMSPRFLVHYFKWLVDLITPLEPIRKPKVLAIEPQVVKAQERTLTPIEKATSSSLGRYLQRLEIVLKTLSQSQTSHRRITIASFKHYITALVMILRPAAEEQVANATLGRYLQHTANFLKAFEQSKIRPTLTLVMHNAKALVAMFTPAETIIANNLISEERKTNPFESYLQGTEAVLKMFGAPLKRKAALEPKLSLNTFNYFANSLTATLTPKIEVESRKPRRSYKKHQKPEQPAEIVQVNTPELKPHTQLKANTRFVSVGDMQIIELLGDKCLQKIYFRKSSLHKLEEYYSSSNGSLTLTRTMTFQYLDGGLIKGFRIVETPKPNGIESTIIDRATFHRKIKPIIQQVVASFTESSNLSDKQICRAISQNYLALAR